MMLHGKTDKIFSYLLSEELNAGIKDSQLKSFQNNVDWLIL